MIHYESAVLICLYEWFSIVHRKHASQYLRIDVGGYRRPAEARVLKKEGQKAGLSDILIAVPIVPYHGLWLEVKTKTGKLSDHQRTFLKNQKNYGYAVCVGYGLQDCESIINDYFLGGLVERFDKP